MGRNFLCALLFALALAVQALAPAAARMAMGSDAPTACSTASVVISADEARPTGLPQVSPELCSLCALCGGVAPPVAPRAAVCAAAIPASLTGWVVADDESAPSRHDHLIRARAPPAFS
ncbi:MULTISPECIES: hypothetical protein [Methylosinus]|uniref:DUF2946 domain-containing protein n=1 Tax=Methylosinus trichosporium (strain ATCC 35070 / NCIMB 11131 / UNIQEM 75 / OB3b) TaxID=595536 RepID=A0A2D2CW02_METT3|nr:MULTISPECIES: hypothetical protein [Methylosinus]ATQ66962.1 hypothetical protein CQW49_02975 [Methylosinus trichosporium OB3b]OBS54070.1 hypothetical protein A8B73_02165 [Methylosinus sp. 3S-1]